MAKDREQKGVFGDAKLRVSPRYVVPPTRRIMLLAGAVASALIILGALADVEFRKGRFLSNGPLASAHAAFEQNCAACHEGGKGPVTDRMCSACHELDRSRGALATYGSGAHYIYRSEEPSREQPKPGRVERSLACIECHGEHQGRYASLTAVPDGKCARCHENDSFVGGHREFEFVRENRIEKDAQTMRFTHARHTCLLIARGAFANVEDACLYCHNPRADGTSFQPIQYDRHCSESRCHLKPEESTERVPRKAGDRPGVELPKDLAASGEPGTAWAFYASERDYRVTGELIDKSNLQHADPWVLTNLRRLRRQVYPGAELADLLVSSGDPSIEGTRALYREAIATLETYASELRVRPQAEVADDLVRVEASLRSLRATLSDPRVPLDAATFALPSGRDEQEADTIGADLTKPCTRQCHVVQSLTIARVQKDQRVLKRAEFDHRAHVVERRCLECHDRIDPLAAAPPECKGDMAKDRAEIQNLPAIANCRACHTPEKASDRCITCHAFHPDRLRRVQLTLNRE